MLVPIPISSRIHTPDAVTDRQRAARKRQRSQTNDYRATLGRIRSPWYSLSCLTCSPTTDSAANGSRDRKMVLGVPFSQRKVFHFPTPENSPRPYTPNSMSRMTRHVSFLTRGLVRTMCLGIYLSAPFRRRRRSPNVRAFVGGPRKPSLLQAEQTLSVLMNTIWLQLSAPRFTMIV